jgi:cytochrome b6-f complex iron-sulfur subunit
MSDEPAKPRPPSRRTFIGWSIGILLTTIVAVVAAPVAVFIFPPHAANRGKGKIRVELPTPIAELKEGTATRFDAPAGMAFIMADGGEQNAAGDPTFGGFLTREQGMLRALAITCPHLGCSYAFDDGKQHFVCPCHGSEFGLDGRLLKGPATSPLSHLTWQTGPGTNEIDVEGLTVGN